MNVLSFLFSASVARYREIMLASFDELKGHSFPVRNRYGMKSEFRNARSNV